MPNFRVMTTLLDYLPTADSEDSTFPADNLLDYGHILRKWAALVSTGTVNMTLDLGAGNTFASLAADPAIFIDDLNVTTLKIQGNTSSSWASPPWNQTVTIAKDGFTQRYKGFWRLADLTATPVSYRYLNLRFESPTPTDGAAYRIGRVGIGTATELLINPLYDPERGVREPVIRTAMLDGGAEVNEMGTRQYWCRLPRQIAGASEWAQELSIQAITPGSIIVLWDSALAGAEHAWMMRRVEDPTYRQPFLDLYEGQWDFEEVI